ncbi:C4-dicarboxylic acid transporter DauA [Marinobacterium sediminicola]|uniref:Sulfate permease, SulP family n=1 Tax=Marinobacterium sediminicola TaxID=518898 RepID=A0ABY1RWK9_9GAMM|nr:C4-dicarboxylic acid transporter DauA [Marinobacterium sediminicola]ULG70270.1 C4-dicarboxylic acid transporter DauA [Marinobacterium sediminicola]SMR69900.1 sulfate permease, SulP family [Marinobacterium sediminicola]
MSRQARLHSLSFASALRATVREGYGRRALMQDLMAGLSVGIIAIPLSMALAIASGVRPEYGLYTAIIAGFIIALAGGSRYSVSGPTAAFVVILYPVAQAYGLAGLLIATLMSAVILLGLAFARMGRLIEYIPEPVTLGFTSGIAIVIATLQVNDFFGLGLDQLPEHWWQKVAALGAAVPTLDMAATAVAVSTLAVLVIWPRLKLPMPGHLPALAVGLLVAWSMGLMGYSVETIGSRFSYLLPDGSLGAGIPPFLPEFAWPWDRPGPDGGTVELSWSLVRELLPAAFSIAMLGAIESLLCAVVLDGMTGKRHHANGELLGQGLGNLIAPFFGGFTATAALARSAANYRAGACSPVASMVHALVVLAGLLLLAPVLAWLPMASMAALLLMVAWNMSEAPKLIALLRKAPPGDVLVLFTCLLLTVLFDMVIAIFAGILLASLLFMRDLAGMTRFTDVSRQTKHVPGELLPGWKVYKLSGPLFFAAADRVFDELQTDIKGSRGVVLYMDGVPLLDAGGLSALTHFTQLCRRQGIELVIADLQFQPLRALARAGMMPVEGELKFTPTLAEALQPLLST